MVLLLYCRFGDVFVMVLSASDRIEIRYWKTTRSKGIAFSRLGRLALVESQPKRECQKTKQSHSLSTPVATTE